MTYVACFASCADGTCDMARTVKFSPIPASRQACQIGRPVCSHLTWLQRCKPGASVASECIGSMRTCVNARMYVVVFNGCTPRCCFWSPAERFGGTDDTCAVPVPSLIATGTLVGMVYWQARHRRSGPWWHHPGCPAGLVATWMDSA
mgnify:CR=1 FL=1